MNEQNWPADKVERRSIGSIIPYARNSRTHSDEQVAQIAASIKEWGFTNPILIDIDGEIIAGHGRLLAAQKLGLKDVPCITAVGWSDAQKKAYVIADNKLALNAGWDNDMLAIEFGKLKDLDFNLDLIGFDSDELANILKEPETEGLTDEDAVPEAPEVPVTVEGDVWILGRHRLMCGDSTSIDAVEKLMDGVKAQTFFTDPPYGDNVGGLETKAAHEREAGKGLVKRVSFIANDKEIDWLEDVFNLVPAFLEDDSTKMVFFKWDRLGQIKSMANAFGEPSALCVWDRVRKASAFFRFQPQHELCFHWGNQSDKKEAASLSNVWRVPKELELKELHPTVKPMSIIEPALRVTTSSGKCVLDLFGGSGTTLIACEKTARDCRMMELDPKYCDVIIKRWQEFTGKSAIHEQSEQSFAEMQKSRGTGG
jgi:DNA modification methylase